MTDNEQARAKAVADYYAAFPKGSAGPIPSKSEPGTQRTRLNAYKHGLTGQIHLFTPEEHAAFEKHCQSIVEALAPSRQSRAATRPIHRRKPLAPQPRPRHRIRHLRARPVGG